MRVLIVDDSVVMRKVVERTLRQAGLAIAEVLEASNGLEALKILRVQTAGGAKLDLILSDINMPEMDGLDFVEQMRAEGLMRGTPVVMITTEGSENQVLRALSAGAAGFIRKPFTVVQVQTSVMKLVNAD